MSSKLPSRREFLADAGLAAAALAYGGSGARAAQPAGRLHVSINQWSVGVLRKRDKQKASVSLDEEVAGLAAAGITGLEPSFGSPDQVPALAATLKKHGLAFRSMYVGSALYDRKKADKELSRIVALAAAAKPAGTRIVVTNPSPLPNRQGKSDEQLKTQAAALQTLGRELAAIGVTLAYHNHNVELQHAAREFHHMMLATDPRAVSLCLDAHWVYRGADNSQVALFDVVKLYGQRIVELHLRQSVATVWSETFGPGDIDYRELAKRLMEIGVRPQLVLEQGPEEKTPQTMDTAAIHRQSVAYVREVFAGLPQ